jgi:hypothetical protein
MNILKIRILARPFGQSMPLNMCWGLISNCSQKGAGQHTLQGSIVALIPMPAAVGENVQD